jgi:hypothetical protein
MIFIGCGLFYLVGGMLPMETSFETSMETTRFIQSLEGGMFKRKSFSIYFNEIFDHRTM